MEDPGYPAAVSLFQASGAKVVGVPVYETGLNCAAGRRKFKSAKLAYVTPNCQFPLGITMSLERRRELLHWAQSENAWIFEDDYDGEFGFSGRPLAALKSLDGAQCVIYSNSFNKVLFPTLRLGYLVVPPKLIDAVAAAKSIMDRFPPVVDQAILCDFISAGHLGQHIRRMREIYADRYNTLISCVRARLEGLMEISPKFTGLQTIGWLAKGIEDIDASRLAASRGIDSVPLSKLTINRSMPPAMVLGVAYADTQAIRSGVNELASVLCELKSRGTRPR
jgi:GntR family transcriptional regulator/MocR family aminotransferase